uniref:Uncharacterized protein n=1 Tax=Arundo donax TaxID=35708 RepID=A0A0A9HXA6_ARUDO
MNNLHCLVLVHQSIFVVLHELPNQENFCTHRLKLVMLISVLLSMNYEVAV